jgi:ABC-type transport system substrate-binding protein
MKKVKLLFYILVFALIAGCGSGGTTEVSPVEPSPTKLPPSVTPKPLPTSTSTNTPEPTALPGEVVYPVASLEYGTPWLPLDKTEVPMVVFFGLNTNKPPFNIPEVRQAFFAALDTEVLTLIYEKGLFYDNEKPARSVIPSVTLSRNVYGEVGIPYDPDLARQLLAEAGYEDVSSFPEVSMLVVYFGGGGYPGLLVQVSKEAIRMWEENLGITVTLEVVGVQDVIKEQPELIQSGEYEIYEYGIRADENDPNSFVYDMFHPDGEDNLLDFDSARVTKLILDGQIEVDPAKRLPIYLEMDRLLSEEEVPIIPIFHCTVDISQW